MKATELRQKDVAALQKATQQLNNTAQMRVTRRSIARAKTILAQKQAAK
jgi:large subunit ribosomal protein L29